MKRALLPAMVLALAACGGGGGGGGPSLPLMAPAAPAAAVVEAKAPASTLPPLQRPTVLNPNCTEAASSYVYCDLVASDQPIGVGVPVNAYVTFTNRTGTYLQVNEARAFTGERAFWSEFCVYVGELVTGQHKPGRGEVGCSTKQIGEDYAPIRWGNDTGLSVAPGESLILNSHTEPAMESHLYALTVAPQQTGLFSWRQPQQDFVFPCDGSEQSTVWAPWRNDSDKDAYLTGASIYAESAGLKSAPNTMSGMACIYVFNADGSRKHTNCDDALRHRGEVEFPTVVIGPGESVAAQAVNACQAPYTWDWVAFLRVYGGAQ